MEFVAKKKTLKVTIGGVSHEMRCPTIGERQEFLERLKAVKPEDAISAYADWYSGLGLPREALYSFDADDFFEFLDFVSNPKKKPLNST
jgi:hypothetical protein